MQPRIRQLRRRRDDLRQKRVGHWAVETTTQFVEGRLTLSVSCSKLADWPSGPRARQGSTLQPDLSYAGRFRFGKRLAEAEGPAVNCLWQGGKIICLNRFAIGISLSAPTDPRCLTTFRGRRSVERCNVSSMDDHLPRSGPIETTIGGSL